MYWTEDVMITADQRWRWRHLRGPARVLEHVPEDGVGDAGPVVTHPDVGPPQLNTQHRD